MSLPLDFHPNVHPEVSQAHQWYESQRPGLGQDFLEAVEDTVSEIEANPQRFGIVRRDVRAGPVGRFPYAAYYRVLPDRVRVIAAVHTSRSPDVWRGRVG